MVELVSISACDGLLPISEGPITLAEVLPAAITSISPIKGRKGALSNAMKAMFRAPFPAPNRATGKEGARVVWMGRDQAFLIGPDSPDLVDATMTDQTDGWAILRLTGKGAEDALARLVPVDLRASAFRRGDTVRTLLNHMPVSITRTGAETLDIMVFRSMTRTAVHEIKVAMKRVNARAS